MLSALNDRNRVDQEIGQIDELADREVREIRVHLDKVANSMSAEATAADREFDAASSSTLRKIGIIAIVAALALLCVALLIIRSIVQPLAGRPCRADRSVERRKRHRSQGVCRKKPRLAGLTAQRDDGGDQEPFCTRDAVESAMRAVASPTTLLLAVVMSVTCCAKLLNCSKPWSRPALGLAPSPCAGK
ncbi:MAG: hypothetical protein CAPSK01_003335 [Candidatus Accumulibacter vicinus]|uniref:Uncharacterized protein n=1 Tax=Candidatus Accumulibacter vicinus TaxID=2954382 RepID=A0A084XXM4_9PROT|nr:MAG: hypothetical protein CAPSK01_003335 [Candidatus Accumulibacter vicinus]